MPISLSDETEEKADLTPMIDVIFLLLIFFILTTKFTPDEKLSPVSCLPIRVRGQLP